MEVEVEVEVEHLLGVRPGLPGAPAVLHVGDEEHVHWDQQGGYQRQAQPQDGDEGGARRPVLRPGVQGGGAAVGVQGEVR